MDLKRSTIRGVVWNSIGNVISQVLRLLTVVVMARLLTPGDYGIYGILMVFVGFFAVLANMGVSQAVIWLDQPSQRMLSSIFWLNLAVGLSLYAILYALATPIAHFFDNTALVVLMRSIASIFVIGALNTVHEALLQKQLRFKELVLYDMAAQIVGAIAGIAAAMAGLGVVSLIIAALSSAITKTLVLWCNTSWRPGIDAALSDLRTIWNYCVNLTGFSFINYFARNADNLLIGKFLGAPALGVYSVAYNIMLYPLTNISGVIVRVLFPALATMKHDDARFKQAYLKVIAFIALVSFPLMAGLAVVAEHLVAVVFGVKWAGLATLLVILAPVGLMQSIVTTVGNIFILKGTTALMFRIGSINAGVIVLSFVMGLPFGVEGVAISYAIANLVMLYPNLKYSWNQVGLRVTEGLAVLKVFFVAAALMALTVHLAGLWLVTHGWAQFAILATQFGTGVLVYVTCLLLLTRLQILKMVREILPAGHSPPIA